MSWIQQQTGPPLQQQQYPPTTTSLPAVAAGVVSQNSTAKFVQQQWQQPPQSQQQQYLFNQQQNSMQQQQPPGSNQNNWFNPSLNAVPHQQQSQNNWQQQQLVPPPPTQSNTEYFIKQQQHQQHPPQLDNFMSIETQAIQQQNSSHYQSIPTYPVQSTLPTLQQPNSTGVAQHFLNTECDKMTTNTQQQFEIFDNHLQQQQQPQGNSNNNEGWDSEWEWNDNNQQSQPQLTTTQQLQQQSNNINTNIIEECFKNEPNDNWQWNIEQPKNESMQPPTNTTKESKSNEIFNALDINVNENRHQSFENPQNINQISGPEINPRNFQSLPLDTTVLSPENMQNSTSNSNVFVSQAKPVAQPPRQFASPPAIATSGSMEKITSMPLTTSTTNSNIVTQPISSQSPGLTNVPPPPAAQTTPQSGALPPPPPLLTQNKNAGGNPFKRSGLPQHHRATSIISSVQPQSVMSTQQQPQLNQQGATSANSFFVPPPAEDFQNLQSSFLSESTGNQEPSAANSKIINTDRQFENQEIALSNDRNQYLQTSHLSEEDFTAINTTSTHSTRIDGIGGQSNENDNLPPPGLSRLVLGQPKIDNPNYNIGEIPPGLDRMIPGTELVSSSSLNLERQADGQDTIPSPRSAFTNVPPVELNDASSNIDITGDRNLYLVPGESEHQVQQQQPQPQRVVTGLENDLPLTQQSSGELRELELDGENLEDEQQINQNNFKQNEIDLSTRDEPLEGANTSDILASGNKTQNNNNSNETESSLTIETHLKDLSNPSTGNDESDNRHHFNKPTLRRTAGTDDKIKKRSGNKENVDKRKERYESEESDMSNEQERRRHHREGSMRNDRGDKDSRESIEKDRRDKRESGNNRGGDRDDRRRFGRNDKERYTARDSKRNDRDRRDRGNDKYENSGRDHRKHGTRYETDSKYETETSRYERNRKDGSDRERDRYDEQKRDDKDRRKYRRTGDGDRHADERRDRRRGGERNDYREERSDRHRNRNEKNRIDYDEDYRKSGSGSRNARDSDREKDRTARIEKDSRYSQMYGYPTGYNYDTYAYYQQQQQYYEQLRRSNPQAYSEWYRKYYGAQAQSADMGLTATDGRESVHSGRSSANNDKDRPENLSLNLIGDGAASLVNQEPQRLTPFKYTNDHSTVSFSAGLLICVKPKYSQNGITNIVKILRLGSNDSTRRLFQTFPGPLIRGLTHKKTIIEYCEEQIRLGPPTTIRSRQNSMSSLCSTNQMNKASFTLMWNLLILLLRQNGMVVGTDIAELLMKNKIHFPYEFASSSVSATKSSSIRLGQNDASNLNENNTVESDSTRKDKILNNVINVDDNNDDAADIDSEDDEEAENELNIKLELSEQEITEKFRNYLLYGNVNEALEWATDNNLWGHALFLASKVDRRSHANVMMKFANKLQLNDPLQTLYQLMSGRTPSSVTSVQDEKWGDWRPHLAMILSNTSQRPELDRKSITTLGDSLYNRGDLFAAQFCYLMAQVGFGKYSAVNPNETTFISNSQNNNAVRLILLGSSHHKMFREFATNEAIMMTEIYEYACSLNDEKFSIVEFQPYKYLLAIRMLDYGYQLKTLMYMEQIALHIQRDPSKYEPTFIEKIYTLADRLKYYDPVLEKTMDDQHQNIVNDFPEGEDVNQQAIADQKWLQDLRCILNEYKTDLYPTYCNYQQQISGDAVVDKSNYETSIEQNRAAIDQQFVEINQQFSKLTMQYNNFDPMQQQEHQIGDESQANIMPQQQQGQLIPQQQQFSQFYNPNEVNVGQIQIMSHDGTNYGDGNNGGYSGNNYIQSQQQNQGFEQQQQQFISSGDQQQHQQDSLSNSAGISSQGNYEYWDQSQQLAQNEVLRPTISLPNSSSGKSGGGYYGNDDDGQNKNDQNGSGGAQQKGNKNDNNKSANKSGNISSASQNSGWFGGIWNKLSLKPKNQMILPDDKNPAIVWDSEKKKWVNTDGDDDPQGNFKPPPKIGDILQASVPPSQSPPLNNYNPSGQQNANIPQHQEQPFIQTNYSQATQPQQQQQIPVMAGQPIQPQNINLTQNYNPGVNNNASSSIGNTAPVNNVPSGEPTKTPNLQSNMFKMQRNRTLKKSYVDVFNPSGAPSKPVEPVLAPVIPSTIPQSGFFIPTPIPGNNQQQQDGGPQFYNPNQFGGYQQ